MALLNECGIAGSYALHEVIAHATGKRKGPPPTEVTRRCVGGGCGKKLSSYNPDIYCYACKERADMARRE